MFKGQVSSTLKLLQLLKQGKSLESMAFTRVQIRRKLADMQREGFVREEKDGRYKITKRGRDLLSEEKIWAFEIPRQKKWDYRWRMVLYDIPAAKRKTRHIFREKLREMGLMLYQNSVWVHPYPLEEIVAVIADFYGLKDCVMFAVAERINGEKRLRQEFGLK